MRVFLAGGVPEVMLHLREVGLLDLDVLTVAGVTLGESLEWWETSERRDGSATCARGEPTASIPRTSSCHLRERASAD